MLEFQFQLVRLKSPGLTIRITAWFVSIPTGSIKIDRPRLFRSSTPVSIPTGSIKILKLQRQYAVPDLFQFQLVRLKYMQIVISLSRT